MLTNKFLEMLMLVFENRLIEWIETMKRVYRFGNIRHFFLWKFVITPYDPDPQFVIPYSGLKKKKGVFFLCWIGVLCICVYLQLSQKWSWNNCFLKFVQILYWVQRFYPKCLKYNSHWDSRWRITDDAAAASDGGS